MTTFINVLDFIIAIITLIGGIAIIAMNAYLAGKSNWSITKFVDECVNSALGDIGLTPLWMNLSVSFLTGVFIYWIGMSLSLYAGLFFFIPALIVKAITARKAKTA